MVVRTDANAAMAEYGRELGSVAVAIAMGESVRLTDAAVDAIVHGDRPAGMGEQPSIINRDPGDETARPDVSQQIVAELRDHQGELSAEIVIARARIVELEAENARWQELWAAERQFWRAHYQGHLTRLLDEIIALRQIGAPSTAPTPPPHNPMANALAHSEPKPAWQR